MPIRFPLDDLWQDLRHAVRTLQKRPGFAASVIVTLALGIGGTTAIFSVVNGVLIRPLPYPEPDALVRIVHSIGGIEQPYFADAIYLTYVDNTQVFQDVGVWSPGETAAITGLGEPEEVRALTASRGVLTTLGVRPEIGRWFSAEDDTPRAPDTVILTNGYWHRRLAGDRGVLERTLTINGRPHQVIGVMPPGFRLDSEGAGDFEIVLPLRVDRGAPDPSFRLLGVARLNPGVGLTQANADVARVLGIYFENVGMRPQVRARWAPALKSLKQDVVGDVGTTLWALLGAIGIVLFMACANIANLLLVRGEARRQEFAIRAAMGARWTRIARQLLVESLTAALLGGALGVGCAYITLRGLVAFAPSSVPRLAEISIDPVVLAFALTIALMSGLFFGLIPILKYARPRLELGAGRSGTLTRRRHRSQQTLVVAQLALALVLLVSAGLMIRSVQALRSVAPGFTQPERVQTFRVSIPATVVPEPARVTRMQQDILDRAAAIPGVVSAAFTTRLPMGSDRASAALLVEGAEVSAGDRRAPPNRQVKIISPGLFRTLGTPLVAGRDFTWADVHDMRDVAIVSENLARELWGSPAAAIGRRVRELFYRDAHWREIIGVAGDVHDDGVDRAAPATIYWPAHPDEHILGMAGFQARRVSVVIRSDSAGTAGLVNQARAAVESVSATLPLAQVRTLDDVYRRSMARASFTLVMLAIAGTMALLLGVSGIYSVIAYAVSQRRREIGIRVALGAQSREIRWLFLRRGLVVVAVGMAIGLSSAAGVTRLIASLLFGTSPLDPIAFAAMSVVLAAAAVLASYLPIRHAVAVDPVETLRAE